MRKYFLIVFLFIILGSCNNNSPKVGLKYKIKNIRYDKEIILPNFDEKTTVEVFENWIVINYTDGNKFVINRDRIWSLEVE